MHLKCEVRDR